MTLTTTPRFLGLLCRRSCWLPTLRGWILAIAVLAALLIFCVWNADRFLAVNKPVPDGVLVVEGWSPDYALETALAEANRDPHHKLYVIGGPLEEGAPLSEYKSFAELGAAVLLRMGMTTNSVQAVPAPYVRKDRTFAAAMALRNWFIQHGGEPKAINLISVGAHARRSRLMFQKAFGNGTRVGIMNVQDRNFDSHRWWTSSAGVRSVLDEMIAYFYARFLFFPSTEKP